jgi:hypothetical protein
MEIEKMLVLSTAHLTPYCCNRFMPENEGNWYDKANYGWFVSVPTDEVPLPEDHNLPACLIDCLKFADLQQCTWIMFDQDGPTVEQLPIQDWD